VEHSPTVEGEWSAKRARLAAPTLSLISLAWRGLSLTLDFDRESSEFRGVHDSTQRGHRAMCVTARDGGGQSMTRNVPDKERQKLSAEVSLLESLDVEQLRARWKILFETEAPPRFSRDLLMHAVAYRIQERVLGGLKPATRRLFERVSQDARARRPIRVAPVRKLAPGALLIRQWGGAKHQVTVLEGGVMFRGKLYRSLSAVARVITGNRWSGPLFFGLKARLKEVPGDGAR
jgi:Protein of unknown function (DUF2924)